MKKNIFIIICILFTATGIFAKNRETDSLLNVIKTTSIDTIRINTLINLADQLRTKGDFDEAMKYSTEALSLSKKIKYTKGEAGATINLGVIYHSKGDYSTAINYYLSALKLSESIGDQKRMSTILNNIAEIHRSKKDYKKAIEYHTSSLELSKKTNNKKGMANSYHNMGIVYWEQGKFDNAISEFRAAVKTYEEIGDLTGSAYAQIGIGVIYEQQENYERSLENYFAAIKLCEKKNDKLGIASCYTNIGNVYKKLKDYDKAIHYANLTLSIANEIGYKELKKESYGNLSEIFSLLNNYKLAFNNHKLFTEMKDSLLNDASTKQIAEMQTKYESEKKEKEIELQKAELGKKEVMIQQQTTQKLAFAGGFGLVLILAGVSYRSFRNKRKAHAILEIKNKIIEEKNKDITDSINYAKTIQQAILPFDHRISEILKDYFILFKPRDIVSGDFYWFTEKDNYIFIAVADCTGHGVPGAFMSMIGSAALTHAVSERGITDAGKILSEVNHKIKDALKQSENNNRDGMDIALLRFEKNNLNKVQFASAMRPLYLFNDSLKEISGSKMGIGGTTSNDYEFVNHELSLNTGDTLYIMSDGYADQFGGINGKKYMSGNLKKLLISFQNKSLNDQKQILEETFESWRGNLEQVDDVCFIGIRI